MKSSAAEVMAKRMSGTTYAAEELFRVEHFIGHVYDVVQSDMGIVDVLHKHGLASFHTSANFYEYDCAFQNVITEPAPNIDEKFVLRALHVAFNKVALLLPLKVIEAPEAKILFDKTPLVRVYVLMKRLPRRRGTMAWFVWEKGNYDAPRIRWI